jgi:hypothetical protein
MDMMAETQMDNEEVIEWLKERLDNCRLIAGTKKFGERAGWMEDARFFEAALTEMEVMAFVKKYKLEITYEADVVNGLSCWNVFFGENGASSIDLNSAICLCVEKIIPNAS